MKSQLEFRESEITTLSKKLRAAEASKEEVQTELIESSRQNEEPEKEKMELKAMYPKIEQLQKEKAELTKQLNKEKEELTKQLNALREACQAAEKKEKDAVSKLQESEQRGSA